MKQFSCGEIVPGYKTIFRPQSATVVLRPSASTTDKKGDGMRALRSSQMGTTGHLPAVA